MAARVTSESVLVFEQLEQQRAGCFEVQGAGRLAGSRAHLGIRAGQQLQHVIFPATVPRAFKRGHGTGHPLRIGVGQVAGDQLGHLRAGGVAQRFERGTQELDWAICVQDVEQPFGSPFIDLRVELFEFAQLHEGAKRAGSLQARIEVGVVLQGVQQQPGIRGVLALHQQPNASGPRQRLRIVDGGAGEILEREPSIFLEQLGHARKARAPALGFHSRPSWQDGFQRGRVDIRELAQNGIGEAAIRITQELGQRRRGRL